MCMCVCCVLCVLCGCGRVCVVTGFANNLFTGPGIHKSMGFHVAQHLNEWVIELKKDKRKKIGQKINAENNMKQECPWNCLC